MMKTQGSGEEETRVSSQVSSRGVYQARQTSEARKATVLRARRPSLALKASASFRNELNTK